MTPQQQLVGHFLEVARAEVGVREAGGPNRGPRIEEYQRAVGARPGDPYCVAGVYWCFARAARELTITGHAFVNPMPRTAGVLRLWDLAPLAVRRPPWTNGGQRPPAPGSLGLHRSASHPGRGHLVIVLDSSGCDLHTIEFNTNPAGSRDGDGVYERERPTEYVDVGYLDFAGDDVAPVVELLA